ncbi:MAG: CDP-alcohol phosphatidyltransferase family protein [Candidatus Omnitrophica bacterium]|nr:CDP-alcohol phosphatidyltransferase family protein [Candidatus Omnitrophota bacterium]
MILWPRQLREKVQGPRRHADTFYGRYVMRRISIYITACLCPFPVSPYWVNLSSILVGAGGAWALSSGHWFLGILLVNGWYLLDHVDGELARAKDFVRATGLFFDTIANAIVPPLAFLGLGVGLSHGGERLEWLAVGFAAFYGSLMMTTVMFCESAVILQRLRQGRLKVPVPDSYGRPRDYQNKSFFRAAFSLIHQLTTFPVFLPIATALIFTVGLGNRPFLEPVLQALLAGYALAANLVWVAVLGARVITEKIDKTYPATK